MVSEISHRQMQSSKFENIKYCHHYTVDNKENQHTFGEKDLVMVIDSELTFAGATITKR